MTSSLPEAPLGQIATDLGLTPSQVRATVELLDGGATVPFVSRYRKEATGGLDEVAVFAIRDRLEASRALEKRRSAVLQSLEEQGKLDDPLRRQVEGARTLAVLEDLYLPYRPRRRTRASQAREKGLEPLARLVLAQEMRHPAGEAARFVSPDKGVASVEEALAGARDIVAEWVSEDAEARGEIRKLYRREARIRSKVARGKKESGAKFSDYFDWSEPLARAPSHRILALRRGAEEGILKLGVDMEESGPLRILERRFVKGRGAAADQVREALEDGYRRLLGPSMVNEVLGDSKQRADQEAISVFAENLRELLLAAPLGQRRVMGLDPGLRTGCKLVCLDGQGKLLAHDAVFPLPPRRDTRGAGRRILELCRKHQIEAIAVGNGTGGREAEQFLRSLDLPESVQVVMVSESGASIYSASEVAREEFPDHDLTVRGAVSIARRLMDPLAELVRIDPKSIGVGQYQHDVDQKALKGALDDVVSSCVNLVGVEVNTASKQLLAYVSGIGPRLAANLVAHRNEHGPFAKRSDLKKVKGLGPKAFEQAAGFLRIRGARNPLDASAVHPERYRLVREIARDLGAQVADLIRDEGLRERIEPTKYVSDEVGLPTLRDILAELARPGRDPREQFEAMAFAEGIHSLEDLEPGMVLPGVVTNVTAFGAFVDVGVHQDGLVHVSQLADRYVASPSDVVKVQQRVQVRVLEVDPKRRRIGLSMRSEEGRGPRGGGGPRERPGAEGRPGSGRNSPPVSSRDRRGRDRGPRSGRGSAPGSSRSGKAKQRPSPPRNNPFAEALKDWKPS